MSIISIYGEGLSAQGKSELPLLLDWFLINLLTMVDLLVFAPFCSYIIARYAKFATKS